MSALKTALTETLSSHGKSSDIIDRALLQLPFVVISGDKVSLVQRKMNRGAAGEGASCVLSFTCSNSSSTDETMYQRISRESSTLAGIRNFVKVCGSQLISQDDKKADLFKFVTQSVTKEQFEVKFLSGSYSYALAVQEYAKRDPKWQLAKVSVLHAMCVDAPSFKPNTSSASLSPVRMPMLNPAENQEILKQNIAHMYKYYNDLINRGSDSTTKFDRPTLPET